MATFLCPRGASASEGPAVSEPSPLLAAPRRSGHGSSQAPFAVTTGRCLPRTRAQEAPLLPEQAHPLPPT